MRGLVLPGVFFALYAAGACPTIYVGDSGELATAVATLGIPHPPGYPAYILLGKLWTLLLPFGSVAARLSFFSGAAAALAVAITCQVARRMGSGLSASVLCAAAFGLSPSFWAEANIQRVYTLAMLGTTVVLWLGLDPQPAPRTAWLPVRRRAR